MVMRSLLMAKHLSLMKRTRKTKGMMRSPKERQKSKTKKRNSWRRMN